MRNALRTGAAVLALSLVASNALAAGTACAKPQDMQALQAAAVQQRLMVAALSCDAAALYNRFVVAYRKELQTSDQALQNFFRRLNARTGTADYHAYKTRLANMSSMQSIGNITAYCASANEMFDTALNASKQSLVAFLSGQSAPADGAFTPCETQLAGPPAAPPAAAPVPQEKPLETVLPAQGGGYAGAN